MTSDSPANSSEAASDLDIRNILLLDDDAELADGLKSILESHNFVVTVAPNGVVGLHEVMTADFDVIICDLMMPTMPGDMFYLAVKKVKPRLCDRFVFITGHRADERVTRFLEQTDGIAIFKPVTAADLLQMITYVLQRNAA